MLVPRKIATILRQMGASAPKSRACHSGHVHRTGIGDVTGASGDFTFGELGARASWKVSERTTLDAFVLATLGEDIGTHTQFGGALRVRF
jgi:hypothetical protein